MVPPDNRVSGTGASCMAYPLGFLSGLLFGHERGCSTEAAGFLSISHPYCNNIPLYPAESILSDRGNTDTAFLRQPFFVSALFLLWRQLFPALHDMSGCFGDFESCIFPDAFG